MSYLIRIIIGEPSHSKISYIHFNTFSVPKATPLRKSINNAVVQDICTSLKYNELVKLIFLMIKLFCIHYLLRLLDVIVQNGDENEMALIEI